MNVNKDENLVIDGNTVYEIDNNCLKSIEPERSNNTNSLAMQLLFALIFKGSL